MKAVVLHGYTDLARQLRVETRPLPVLKRGQVLVRMAVASINPSDLVFLRRLYGIIKPLPVIPGFEGSGIVVNANGSAARRLIGVRVACRAPEDSHGTWAEYMACSAETCAPLRRTVSFEQGAALWVNPLTAWMMLEHVQRGGHRAFIQTAAAGAVGRMIARLAKQRRLRGIHIVRRPEQVTLLRRDGVEHVLDSSAPHFMRRLETLSRALRPSMALDAVGGAISPVIAHALEPGGQVLVYGGLAGEPCAVNPTDLIFQRKSLSGFWLTRELRNLPRATVQRYLSAVQGHLKGVLATQVQARFPIERIHDALRAYKARRTDGKVVLEFSHAL